MYLIVCIKCKGTYIGQTECLRERMNNTKSSIRRVNAPSLPYTTYQQMQELKRTHVQSLPNLYESDIMFRKFKECRFIKRFKQTLNGK